MTLHFKAMLFILILAFPREITGATFFRQFENGNHKLNCSQSATEYVWYKGRSWSLQQFEPISSTQTKDSQQRCVERSLCPQKVLPYTTFSRGGIFACAPWTPLFTNYTHCSISDFYLVAIRNRTAEKEVFGNVTESLKPVLAVKEKGNFTLSCEVEIKHKSKTFALYWIKDTSPSACLLSASNEGNHGSNLSFDVNCCVDPTVKERRDNHSVISDDRKINHTLTIFNATSSDSGMYLCVVTAWEHKHVWKIAYNVSIEVENTYNMSINAENPTTLSPPSTNALPISLGVIGGVILICGIMWLLYWKKKSKGNPVERLGRNQAAVEMEGDECSPYAVSSRNDIDRIETVYSLVTAPRKGISSLPDGKPTSEPGEKVHTVYAVVTK